MMIVFPFSDCCVQQDLRRLKSQTVWTLCDVVERIWILDVQLRNQQQLCNAVISIWTKISKKCSQHLVKSLP